MPLVRKRALHDDATSKDQPQANPRKRAKVQTMYREFDKIGYTQDQFHTLIRAIPDAIERLEKLLSKHLGCFLNGRGGILCFGVRENGTIYGESITRCQEDTLKLIVDNTLKKFHPLVHPAKYRVSFTPVKATTSTTLQVLEIRVNPGDRYQMYEDMDHQVHVRKTGGVYCTLTPHEIKHLTVLQLRKKMEEEGTSKAKYLPPPTSSGTSGVRSNEVKPNDVKSNDVNVKPNHVKKEDVSVSKLKSCVMKVDIKRDHIKTLSHVQPSCPLPPTHQLLPPRPHHPIHSVIPPPPLRYNYNEYWFSDSNHFYYH